MENDRKEKIAKIEDIVKELPQEAQIAFFWTMKHIELVQEVGQNAGLTVEEIEKYRMDAIAKDDYIMLAFLSAAQIYEGEKERT